MTSGLKVLVVGGDMFLGRILRTRLPEWGFSVRAIENAAFEAASAKEEVMVGSLTDLCFLEAACRDIDIVIDLSKLDLGRRGGGDLAYYATGVANLWEAARRCKVRRVISATPDGVVGFYRRSAVLDHLSLPRPDGPAGVGGAFIESMASLYAYKHGISALCIRMGSCRPEPTDERMLSTWISPEDFLRLIRVGLTVDYTCEIVYGISANARGWWDNANALRLGYRPADRAEVFADALRGQRSGNIIENVFQGGPTVAANFEGDIRRIP
jgi:uronate dehydrogenase